MTAATFEAIVRPLVTIVLVAAQIFLAYLWALGAAGAKDAFAGLMPLTSMALLFWFKSREEEKAQAATIAAVAQATGTGNGLIPPAGASSAPAAPPVSSGAGGSGAPPASNP